MFVSFRRNSPREPLKALERKLFQWISMIRNDLSDEDERR